MKYQVTLNKHDFSGSEIVEVEADGMSSDANQIRFYKGEAVENKVVYSIPAHRLVEAQVAEYCKTNPDAA